MDWSDTPLRILLVEDSAEDKLIFGHALLRSGVKATFQLVPDGLKAIEYLSGEGAYTDRSVFPLPDVVLTDLKMPRRDGFELLAWIQQRPELSEIPRVVLSASQLMSDIERAYGLGANIFLTKPGSIDTYREVLRGLCRFVQILSMKVVTS